MSRKWVAGVVAVFAIASLISRHSTVFATSFTFIQVPVVVRDALGNYVKGLTPTDFQLLDDGVPVSQGEVKLDATTDAISVAVVVQTNASAAGELATVKKAAGGFGSLVAAGTDEVALLAFDDRVQILQPFTSNLDQFEKSFERLKPRSEHQHLDDAAIEAINLLRTRGKTRKKVLIIVSESRDAGSKFDSRDVLMNAEITDVQIHAIILDASSKIADIVPSFKEIFEGKGRTVLPDPLGAYVKFTGGLEGIFDSNGGLEQVLSRIGDEIRNQYVLLLFPRVTPKAGYHNIEVKVISGANYTTSTRQGYWWAPNAPDPTKSSAPR